MSPARLEWGVASLTLPGEPACGDLHVVRPTPAGTLIGVVDGLGHGQEAADAAGRAVALLERHAGEPLPSLVRRCHDALQGTRGAVMTLAWFGAGDDTMTWIGVGNVEGILLRGDVRAMGQSLTIVQRGGVVGYDLPALRSAAVPFGRGDVLILATDGIRSGFAEQLSLGGPAQRIADHILAEYSRGTDDALVLVARCVGPGP